MRAKTRDEIENAQREANVSSSEGTGPSPISSYLDRSTEITRTPNASLTICLCVYRLRLFPVWPIISVEEIIASLHKDENNDEIYALANAIGAASIAQLRLDIAGANAAVGSKMAEECERVKLTINTSTGLTPNLIRIAFFLHVFYENQNGGGVKSLMYLREAISMAQIMGIDREQALLQLPFEEQQIRRRILWLLFVTERGVALLYRLPVILKPSTGFPSIDGEDESPIFVAVQKLVNLFFIFDQSGAFDILQQTEAGLFDLGEIETTSRQCLESLRQRLQNTLLEHAPSNDVQRADICVTRQWMLAKIWTATEGGLHISKAQSPADSGLDPIAIAQGFLKGIATLPKPAIEAHGPTMEFKVYEIACAVINAIVNRQPLPRDMSKEANETLSHLHQVLSSIRGGNTPLSGMLWSKLSEIRQTFPLEATPSNLNFPSASSSESQWHSDSSPTSHTISTSTEFVSERPMATGGPNVNNNSDNEQVEDGQGYRPPYAETAWSTDSMDQLLPASTVNPSRQQPYPLDFYTLDGLVGEMEQTDILNSFLSTGNNPWEVFHT